MLRRLSLLTTTVLALTAANSSAMRHARLERAVPAIDGTVTATPIAIHLWFNEMVTARLTTATIVTPDSTTVATVTFIATPDSLNVVGPVGTVLAPGDYRMLWRTMSVDGHPIRGEYRFRYVR